MITIGLDPESLCNMLCQYPGQSALGILAFAIFSFVLYCSLHPDEAGGCVGVLLFGANAYLIGMAILTAVATGCELMYKAGLANLYAVLTVGAAIIVGTLGGILIGMRHKKPEVTK